MPPPPKTEYRYDPEQDTSLVGSLLKGQGTFGGYPAILGGPGIGALNAGEEQRRALQDRAVAIIEESLADAEASLDINMEKLVPAVMRALEDPTTKDGEIRTLLRMPYNLDDPNRRTVNRAIIAGRPPPTAAAPEATPAGGTGKPRDPSALRNLFLAAVDRATNAKTVAERDAAIIEVQTLGPLYKDVANLLDGQVTLGDNTIITTAMLNNPDPAVAQQYKQAFADKATKIDNDFATTMNAFNVEGYNLARQSVNDQNSTAIAQFNAQSAHIRDLLSRDQIDVQRAGVELTRALQGLQESRSRTELETKTQLEAAPWATTGGKTEFSGNDLGGALAQLQRQGGGDTSQPIVRFTGTTMVDPTAGMARRDAEFGVTGALPNVPGLTVQAGDIPAAPMLQNPAITMPERIAPKPRQAITMPTQQGAWRGYDASGMAP